MIQSNFSRSYFKDTALLVYFLVEERGQDTG